MHIDFKKTYDLVMREVYNILIQFDMPKKVFWIIKYISVTL
jgi:hypothetical protein